MSTNLIIVSTIFSLIIIFSIIFLVLKKRISVKFALIWILLFIILLLFILIPGLLISVTDFLGFQTSSNMILCILCAILIAINIATTVVVTKRGKDIKNLTQEIALLKKENENWK